MQPSTERSCSQRLCVQSAPQMSSVWSALGSAANYLSDISSTTMERVKNLEGWPTSHEKDSDEDTAYDSDEEDVESGMQHVSSDSDSTDSSEEEEEEDIAALPVEEQMRAVSKIAIEKAASYVAGGAISSRLFYVKAARMQWTECDQTHTVMAMPLSSPMAALLWMCEKHDNINNVHGSRMYKSDLGQIITWWIACGDRAVKHAKDTLGGELGERVVLSHPLKAEGSCGNSKQKEEDLQERPEPLEDQPRPMQELYIPANAHNNAFQQIYLGVRVGNTATEETDALHTIHHIASDYADMEGHSIPMPRHFYFWMFSMGNASVQVYWLGEAHPYQYFLRLGGIERIGVLATHYGELFAFRKIDIEDGLVRQIIKPKLASLGLPYFQEMVRTYPTPGPSRPRGHTGQKMIRESGVFEV